MHPLEEFYEERLQEIEDYLALLTSLENSVQSGIPHMGDMESPISTQQQRILYSSLYLQLYNFIEATVSKCLEGVCQAIDGAAVKPNDLLPPLRREWARGAAQTHSDINYDNRLQRVVDLCEHFIQSRTISSMKIEVGGGGNFHDELIYKISNRLGCSLNISKSTIRYIKTPFRNELGPLKLIVKLRNDLAHGNISFGECGANVTVGELRSLKEYTTTYLKEVIFSFREFIENCAFIVPERRPVKELSP